MPEVPTSIERTTGGIAKADGGILGFKGRRRVDAEDDGLGRGRARATDRAIVGGGCEYCTEDGEWGLVVAGVCCTLEGGVVETVKGSARAECRAVAVAVAVAGK